MEELKNNIVVRLEELNILKFITFDKINEIAKEFNISTKELAGILEINQASYNLLKEGGIKTTKIFKESKVKRQQLKIEQEEEIWENRKEEVKKLLNTNNITNTIDISQLKELVKELNISEEDLAINILGMKNIEYRRLKKGQIRLARILAKTNRKEEKEENKVFKKNEEQKFVKLKEHITGETIEETLKNPMLALYYEIKNKLKGYPDNIIDIYGKKLLKNGVIYPEGGEISEEYIKDNKEDIITQVERTIFGFCEKNYDYRLKEEYITEGIKHIINNCGDFEKNKLTTNDLQLFVEYRINREMEAIEENREYRRSDKRNNIIKISGEMQKNGCNGTEILFCLIQNHGYSREDIERCVKDNKLTGKTKRHIKEYKEKNVKKQQDAR